MTPTVTRIVADDSLPKTADLAIVGGGIIGCSAAYYLARRGLSVVLVEKGHVACEQSSRNWGWVRQQGRAEAEMALSREALRLWGELQAESPKDLGFRQTGLLYATEAEEDLERWRKWQQTARKYQIESRLLGAESAKELTPGCTIPWIGGLYTQTDGCAEPALAAPAIAELARAEGAVILEHCAARGLELDRHRITGLVTERGTVKTEKVICAGGVWTALFCRRHQVKLPLLGLRATAMRTRKAPDATNVVLGTEPFCIRRRLDGGYTVARRSPLRLDLTPEAFRHMAVFWPAFLKEGGKLRIGLGRPFFEAWRRPKDWPLHEPSPFENESVRIADPEPDPDPIDRAIAAVRNAFPALSEIEMAESWAGLIDATPDAVPVISEVSEIDGFYLAAGSSGHGFGTGPAAGHLIADIALGEEPLVDPYPFRYSRLVDGTTLVPETGF